ncbi:hypothetical protein MMC28_002744 [Mycoblastus sanguinarius]|nr:hypothetical protein [Mycoblastus sanguinarius]
MDKAKNIAKGGWRPENKLAIRENHKHVNKVAGLVGHGKSTDTHLDPSNHTSRPLASLKDPDAFGPPPKNVNFHAGAALPNSVTPDRRGLGAPLTAEEVRAKEAEEQQAVQKPAPPPVPYRANTTGLSTNNLPKPPVRRTDSPIQTNAPSPTTRPKPSLPPRLPPRQNSHPTAQAPSPPPTYTAATSQPSPQTGYLNQGALNRLGSAGVSVPGLNIGGNTSTNTHDSNPWTDSPPSNTPSSPSYPSPAQQSSFGGLQSRFSKLSTTSPPPAAPTQGTSVQQKQDALRTASLFRNDPSSVSLSDAKNTASTANDFRERHGEQVASGWKGANALNKKYDVANRVNGLAGSGNASRVVQPPPSPWADELSASPARDGPIMMRDNTTSPPAGVFKKAPPPPPPATRRPGVASPPPVPLSSKPK